MIFRGAPLFLEYIFGNNRTAKFGMRKSVAITATDFYFCPIAILVFCVAALLLFGVGSAFAVAQF